MSLFATPAAPQQSAEQAWSGRVFRILLTVLSMPGHLEKIPPPDFLTAELPVAFWPPVALASRGTRCALVGVSELSANEITDHTGAALTTAEKAELVAFARFPVAGDLLKLERGTPAFPEIGATAVVQVASLRASDSAQQDVGSITLTISGPGVDGTASVLVAPGSTDLDLVLREREAACSLPPTGIDLWLIDTEGRVVGLPRSSTLTWKENC